MMPPWIQCPNCHPSQTQGVAAARPNPGEGLRAGGRGIYPKGGG